MKKLLAAAALLFLASPAAFGQVYDGVLISEIVDGNEADGIPRYVEITNSHPVCDADLKNLMLRRYANGGPFCAHVMLADVILRPGESFVIAAAPFDSTWGGPFASRQADQIDITANGNGNDVYELVYVNPNGGAEEVIDLYGEVGVSGDGQDWYFMDGIVQRNLASVDGNDGNFSMSDFGVAFYATDLATPGWRDEFPGGTITSIETETVAGFDLAQNYPNPFNPSTSFIVSVDEQQTIEVSVYDALGREIEQLFSGMALPNQSLELTFEASSSLPSGLYLYRVAGEFGSITKQMTLLK